MAGFQQLKVNRALEFVGDANYLANIKGNPSFDKVVFYDDFLGDALDARWAPSGDNGGTEAITAGTGGTATLTTGATDDDRSILASDLNWYCAQNPVVEIRAKINTITTAGIVLGFNDAITEANDTMPFEITAAAATLVNGKCTDGVAFVFDTDGSVDKWYMAATKADAEGTPVITAYAPVAATYETFRIALNTLGDATFYRNGALVGRQPACITTTAPLCIFMGLISRSAGARILTVDYVKAWQDRS